MFFPNLKNTKNKQKGKRTRKIPPKSAEFVQDINDETSIKAIKRNVVDKAEAAANEQYDENADDGADLQDFIEPDETLKKIKSTPTALDITEQQLKKQELPVGRYKWRPPIEEDDDKEVKPNPTPPTKRRMLEPKSLHMPTGSQQVVVDDDDDAFAVTVHQPANNPKSKNKSGGNDDELDKGDEPIPCPICEHNLIVFQTKTGDDGITCSNNNCGVKFICNTDIGTILCNMENDIHPTFKAPNLLAHCNVHNKVMKMYNVPKDFQPQEYIGVFMLECSNNVKDGKCENVLYMQKDRFSKAQQGFQNVFKRMKTAKREMQWKTNRIRSSYREAQITYHTRNQPQDHQQQPWRREILKTSVWLPVPEDEQFFLSFQNTEHFFLIIVVFEKIIAAEAWCMMIYVHLLKGWE